jgi:hypothetical protein
MEFMSMFWESVTAGLKILGFWQTYVVALGMTVIVVFPKLYLALLPDRFMYGADVPLSPTVICYLIRHHWIDGFDKLKDRAYKGHFAGGFKGLLVIGLAEFFGGYFAILTLIPLMLGTGAHANWAIPWVLPFRDTVLFLKIIGALLLTIIILGRVPILGEMLVYPVSVGVIAHFTGMTNTMLVPNFWLGCGLVLAGVAAKYAIVGVVALVVAFMPGDVVFSRFSKATSIIFFCLLPVLNLLPAFIYAGWISMHL